MAGLMIEGEKKSRNTMILFWLPGETLQLDWSEFCPPELRTGHIQIFFLYRSQ